MQGPLKKHYVCFYIKITASESSINHRLLQSFILCWVLYCFVLQPVFVGAVDLFTACIYISGNQLTFLKLAFRFNLSALVSAFGCSHFCKLKHLETLGDLIPETIPV